MVTTGADEHRERPVADGAYPGVPAQAEALLAASVDGLSVHDPMGAYLYVSPSFEQLTGLAAEAVVGRSPFELGVFHPDDVGRVVEVHAAALESGEPWRITYRFRRADGAFIWVESVGVLVAGVEDRLVSWTRDVGRLTSLFEGLEHERDAKARLDELLAQQRAFLTGISHRARTPMTVVLGFSKLLQEQHAHLDLDRRSELVDRLAVNAERLASLLASLTEADGLARGEMTVERRVLDLADIVGTVLADVTATEATVRLDIPAGLRLIADEAKVVRILDILLTNAFLHGGFGVSVTVRAVSEEGGVTLVVEDDGPGVDPADRTRIFTAFERGDAEAADPGAGIGLYVVSELAALHGGRAWASERPGGGAAFHVHFPRPLRPAAGEPPTAEVSTPAAGPLDATAHGFLSTLLGSVRGQLDMDAIYLSVFDGDEQVVIAIAGDGERVGIAEGDRIPLAQTYCLRMALGELDQLLPDTAAEPAVAHLPATHGGIACYVGVPVHLPSGHLLGSLCGAHGEARPDLTPETVEVLATFGRAMGDQLSQRGVLDRSLLRATTRVADVLGAPTSVAVSFQPVVELATGAITRYQALAEFGDGRPGGLWLADAARVGLLTDLELLIARRALDQLDELPDGRSVTIAMSPETVVSGHLAELFADVDLGRVVVAISQQANIDGYDAIRSVLAPLRQRGLRLRISDAGAGYGSLRHIRRLRPAVIAAHHSLVAVGDRTPAQQAALRQLAELARELDAQLVADDVDGADTLRWAAEAGFTHARGELAISEGTAGLATESRR